MSESTSQPSPRRWLRWLGRSAFILVALVTLAALAGSVGGWWARRSWRQLKAELQATGRLSKVESFIPAPIPDEENFAAIPLLREQWDEIAKERTAEEFLVSLDFDLLPEFKLGTMGVQFKEEPWEDPDVRAALDSTGLGSVQPGETAAAASLRGLGPLEASMSAIAEGVRRPGCRFPIPHESYGARPSFIGFVRIARVFSFRAMVRLEMKDADKAADDVLTILRLGAHHRRDPGAVGQALGSAISRQGVVRIWHGCLRRAWTETHLVAFERELKTIDIFEGIHRSLRYDTSSAVALWEKSAQKDSLGTFGGLFGNAFFYLALSDLLQTGADLADALPRRRPAHFRPEPPFRIFGQIQDESGRMNRAFSAISFHSYRLTLERLAETQARFDLCLAAVRLERARIQAGRYPANVGGLRLPNDFMSGQPLRYEVSADGSKFRLLGQGWALDGIRATAFLPTANGLWSWSSAPGGPAKWASNSRD